MTVNVVITIRGLSDGMDEVHIESEETSLDSHPAYWREAIDDAVRRAERRAKRAVGAL